LFLRKLGGAFINLKHHIGLFKKGILRLRDHFTENSDVLDEVHFLALGVTEMAYMAEFVIDSCLATSLQGSLDF